MCILILGCKGLNKVSQWSFLNCTICMSTPGWTDTLLDHLHVYSWVDRHIAGVECQSWPFQLEAEVWGISLTYLGTGCICTHSSCIRTLIIVQQAFMILSRWHHSNCLTISKTEYLQQIHSNTHNSKFPWFINLSLNNSAALENWSKSPCALISPDN